MKTKYQSAKSIFMKRLIFVLLLSCLLNLLLAQPQLIRQDTFLLPFKVGYADNQLQILKDFNLLEHHGKYQKELMKITQLDFEDGDLIVGYNLVGPDDLFYYDVRFQLLDKNEKVIPFSNYKLVGDHDQISPPAKPELEMYWMDASESQIYFDQSYQLKTEIELYSQKISDCIRPKFGIKKWLPHIGGAIVSGTIFWISNNIKTQAEDIYNKEYIPAWTGDDSKGISPANSDTGKAIYERFEDRKDDHRIYNGVGWTTVGLNTAWLAIRLNNHRNKTKLYKRYCGRP